MDFSITWERIVNDMQIKYGISANDKEKRSMAEIERLIEHIWSDYCDELDAEYARVSTVA